MPSIVVDGTFLKSTYKETMFFANMLDEAGELYETFFYKILYMLA